MCLLWLQAQLPLPAVMTHSVAETDAAIVQLCWCLHNPCSAAPPAALRRELYLRRPAEMIDRVLHVTGFYTHLT